MNKTNNDDSSFLHFYYAGIIGSSDTSGPDRMLLSVAVAVILSALAWITEDLYRAFQKCSVQSANKTAVTPPSTTTTINPTPEDIP